MRTEQGSAPVEFVLVGTLLTVLTLAVLQLAFAIYVRNVVLDAAVEGAHYAALADTTLAEGAEVTAEAISRAVGADFVTDVMAGESTALGYSTATITVRTTFPLIGLVGIPYGMEVTAHAPAETLTD